MTNEKFFGLRHGVLYEASPRLLSPWALRVNPDNQYDQNYGQFVMLTVPEDDTGYFSGQTWMVDTYHFDIPGVKVKEGQHRHDAIIEKAAKRDFVPSATIGYLRGNCYYNACVQLDESNVDLFTEVCDLREWQYVSDDDAPDYPMDDLIHGVHLYREQGYAWGSGDIGITLRRKESEQSPVRQARAIVSKMERERPQYNGWSYLRWAEELEKFVYEHRNDEQVAEILQSKEREIAFVRRVRDDWHDEFYDSWSRDQMRLFSFDDDGNILVGSETDDED